MKKVMTSLALAAILVSGGAMAQTASPDVPGHPRENEINQRLDNQQIRTDNGVKDGQINANQEMRDQKTDAHVSQEESKDEAKNGGTLTKAEQNKMNKQLNHNSKRIHRQRTKGAAPTGATGTTPAPGTTP